MKTKNKIVLENDLQTIVDHDGIYYVEDKKDKVCVLPYTISASGLLDKIGVLKDWNYIEKELVLTLINGYLTSDDKTDLLAANRLLFELIGTNVDNADKWMYLGNLYNNMNSDSPIKIYCVDITGIEIKKDENVDDKEERKMFLMLDSSKVVQTDDILFLASFLRLLDFFYVNSLNNNKEK